MEKKERSWLFFSAAFFGMVWTLFAVNATKKLKHCSLFFTISILIVHEMSARKSLRQALACAYLALFCNVLWQAKVLNLCTLCSFGGLALSLTWVALLAPHKNIHPLRSLLGALCGAILLDALVMWLWEYHTFPFAKAIRILQRSLKYKVGTSLLFLTGYGVAHTTEYLRACCVSKRTKRSTL